MLLWAVSCSKSEGVCETLTIGATLTMLYVSCDAGMDLVCVYFVLETEAGAGRAIAPDFQSC